MSEPGERWIWICGWGIPLDWFAEVAAREIPGRRHTVVPPAPDALKKIAWRGFDRAGGYSLGAFLLLSHRNAIPLPATLLSPFFGYAAEANLGGKIRRARIRFLSRWLQREPLAALADFYAHAGLDIPPPTKLPYPLEDLLWGLDVLASRQTDAELPERWEGFLGEDDPLLDSRKIKELLPGYTLVPYAGHHPARLLNARRNPLAT